MTFCQLLIAVLLFEHASDERKKGKLILFKINITLPKILFNLIVYVDTNSNLDNIKDKIPHDQRKHVIYKIKCPGCNGCYIGKIDIYLITRITEHSTKETLCLNISLNIIVGCIPFRYYSMKMKTTTCL